MEETVHRLLRGVGPKSFRTSPDSLDALFVCTADVSAPAGFEGHWACVAASEELAPQFQDEAAMAEIEVVVLFTATADERQRATVLKFSAALPSASPPVVVVPISPGAAAGRAEAARARDGAVSLVKASCVDGVIWGMPAGHALAFQVTSQVSQMDAQLNELHNRMLIHTAASMKSHAMRHAMHRISWQYLRAKCFQNIPRIRDIQEDDYSVAGLELGPKVSRGHFGLVRVATRPPSARATWQQCSALVIETTHRAFPVRDLHMISNFLQLMQTMANNGSRHPRIANLLGIIHTPTRLCVCMESSGSTALFTRLRLLSAEQPNAQPLTPNKIRCLITQVTDALQHLHSVVQVCHRDLKPENITIEDDEQDRVNIRLGGFELGKLQRAGSRCQTACGTLPFAAPEAIVTQQGGYDGFPADMWSLGMVCMEVACGLHVVEKTLPWPSLKAGPSAEISSKIVETFGQAGFIQDFLQRCRPEAVPIRGWLTDIVSRLIRVAPEERTTASELHKALAEATLLGDAGVLSEPELPLERSESPLLVA